MAGDFRTPAAFELGVAQRFLVSRNARPDLVRRDSFLTTTMATSFSADVEALAGDEIQITLLPAAGIDGALQGVDSGPAAFDMTSDRPPQIGKGIFAPACYGGSLDDVRVCRRALPCWIAP